MKPDGYCKNKLRLLETATRGLTEVVTKRSCKAADINRRRDEEAIINDLPRRPINPHG